jgi:hypothetical protein
MGTVHNVADITLTFISVLASLGIRELWLRAATRQREKLLSQCQILQ